MHSIETERLIIRPLQPKDHDDLQAIILDPEVVKYTRYRDTTTPESFTKIFEEHFLTETKYTFGIEDKLSRHIIGFYEFHPSKDTGILTYALGQSAWGHGYVAEVGRAMMKYGFTELNFQRIEAHYANLNPRSGRVMSKMGMRDLGEVEVFTFPTGGVVHVLAYELTKDDWLNGKQEQAV